MDFSRPVIIRNDWAMVPRAIPIIIALDPAVAGTSNIHSCTSGILNNFIELKPIE